MNKIYIKGDVHAKFSELMMPKADWIGAGDYLIVCGDFGIWEWPPNQDVTFDRLAKMPYTILFVDGNHENFDVLYSLPVEEWHGGKVHKIRDNVIHLMRGQVFEICGKTFFTMGGASSHDIMDGILEPDDPELERKIGILNRAERYFYRINHVSWWKEELPSPEEYAEAVENLTRHGWRVDCVLTHCCPNEIQDMLSYGNYEYDELTTWLEWLRTKLSFRHWFFGHYHSDRTFGIRYHLLYREFFDLSDVIEDE